MSDVQKFRIVVIDDNPTVRDTVSAVVNSTDDLVTVGVAPDGVEGLATAIAQKPDLVITDIAMPGGGPGLVEALKKALPDTPVLAFSGQPEDGVVLQMMEAGTLSYVAKGTPLAELLRGIRRALGGKRTASDSVAPMVSRWLVDQRRSGRLGALVKATSQTDADK